MGHSPGKSALGAYTHLNELKRHFDEAVYREWLPLLDAIQSRTAELFVHQN